METICKAMETMIVNSSDPYSVWLTQESHGPLSGSPASIYSDYPLHQPSPSPAPYTLPTPPTKSSQLKQSKKKAPGHISRPPNAFLLFRSDFWALEKQKPRPVERDHRDISRIAAHCWRELSPELKEMYYEKAQQLREMHKLQYPDYRLRPAPRRPRSLKQKSSSTLAAEERCRRLASSIMESATPSRGATTSQASHPIPEQSHQGLEPLSWAVAVDHSPNVVSSHPCIPMQEETRVYPGSETGPIYPPGCTPSYTVHPQLQLELQPLVTYDHPQVSLLLNGANSIPPLPGSEEEGSSTTNQSWSMPFQGAAELQCLVADAQYWANSMSVVGADTDYTKFGDLLYG